VDARDKIRQVARLFDIPTSSLSDHVNGRTLTRKRGPTSVMTPEEESQLVQYAMKMADLGYPLNLGQLKIKVAEMTQDRPTPFIDGVPGGSWVKWFRRRHPDLILRSSQGLEIARAKGLCPVNVATFSDNLRELYDEHHYAPSHIWNCNETGAQAGRSNGGHVLNKRCKERALYYPEES
jgi:hypothetical protein